MSHSSTPTTGFGSRVRKSPFFASTRKYGCNAYTVYNHTYMPIHYGDPLEEYRQLISAVTLWDVACERQVEISGPDASRFVQLLTPRNLSTMQVGQAKYVPLVDENGGMINDPIALRIEADRYWLSLADSDVLLWAKGVAWGHDFNVRLSEPDVSPLQLQGPRSTDVIRSVVGDWVLDLKYFWFRQIEIEGIPVVLSRTGWSNERGYELFLQDGTRGDELWEILMQAGKQHGITPACPNQIKRMEAGLLSYHNDMNLGTNPYELGMGKFIDLDQEADFIGKAALRKIAREGIRNRLLGAWVEGDPLPVNEHRWPVETGGKVVGELTSCCYSPSLESNLAYIYLPIEYAVPGQRVMVQTVQGPRSAELCELPFLKNRAAA
jgi:glycine cleavage system aminomethyltransferase T